LCRLDQTRQKFWQCNKEICISVKTDIREENGSRMAQQKQCCLWRNGLAVKQKQTNKKE
jgi:hypothetical protein